MEKEQSAVEYCEEKFPQTTSEFKKILDGKYVGSNHIINFINKNKNIYEINSHIRRNEGLELHL